MQQCARRQRQASTLLHVEPAATPKEDSATFVGTLVVTRRREWRHFKAPSAWQGRGRADLPSGSDLVISMSLSLSMYVALTYIPGGGLLTGFAMRSDPKGFSGLVHP